MDRNVRIAKQLVKLAKMLVADENVADKAGKYENFTGEIEWKGINGTVQNAFFELKDNGKFDIVWEDGTWKSGVWDKGDWGYGTWLDGTWKSGTWEGGSWNDGTWENGNWHNGVWWTGVWKGGNWEGGEEGALFEKGDAGSYHEDSPDKWVK